MVLYSKGATDITNPKWSKTTSFFNSDSDFRDFLDFFGIFLWLNVLKGTKNFPPAWNLINNITSYIAVDFENSQLFLG